MYRITKNRLLAATPALKGGVLRCSLNGDFSGSTNCALKCGVLDPLRNLSIKQVPEDFAVKEAIRPKLGKKGEYLYFWLKKSDWTTLSAVQAVASVLGRELKDFGWAGNKDRRAVTEQLVSVRNEKEDLLKRLKLKDIGINVLGRGPEPITLGSNVGNRFEIVVRNLDGFKKHRIYPIPNYFDKQRFSTSNAGIGKSLVKRDFEHALRLILQTGSSCEDLIERHLACSPKDFIGALKILPKKMLMLYLHAYQAEIFNKILCARLKAKAKKLRSVYTSFGKLLFPLEKVKNETIPIIGFGTSPDRQLLRILAEERLSPRDFIFRELPQLSSEGGGRDMLIKLKNLKIGRLQKDELNPGKTKLKLSVELPKGCYATMVIRALF